jgi:galactokinase
MLENKTPIDLVRVRNNFATLYGGRVPRFFRAPGRVNLIGEHTDYNDGFVLPMGIDRETVVGAAPRDDRFLMVTSSALDETVKLDLDRPGSRRRGVWFDYVEGVAQALIGYGRALRGADLLIESNVPIGAGLSSSAALEVSIGKALLAISEQELDCLTLALAGREAEHAYVGTMCGIMDQYVATFAEANRALLLDCRSLESTLIPIDLSDNAVVVCDTNVKHNLASSEYNTRRSQCEQGVRLLKEVLPEITSLRDVTIEQFEIYQDRLPEVIRRRCKHVITENARTLKAADALRMNDLKSMGSLMDESHRSLRDDYEVSCGELDLMVEIARSLPDVTGSRMTGGGFGGCTINLVQRSRLEDFCEAVSSEYERKTGIVPSLHIVNPADGVKEIGSSV